MAILTGPAASTSNVIRAMIRNNRDEPFGLGEGPEGGGDDALHMAIRQLLRLMAKLTDIIEFIAKRKSMHALSGSWGGDDLESEG